MIVPPRTLRGSSSFCSLLSIFENFFNNSLFPHPNLLLNPFGVLILFIFSFPGFRPGLFTLNPSGVRNSSYLFFSGFTPGAFLRGVAEANSSIIFMLPAALLLSSSLRRTLQGSVRYSAFSKTSSTIPFFLIRIYC